MPQKTQASPYIMHKTHHQPTLSRTNYGQRISALIVIIFVVAIGVTLLVSSHAATPYASTEAESGQLSSGARVTESGLASNDSYVSFGTSATTPPASTYPAQILNLTNWKITMPYDSSGKLFEKGVTPGDAVEVQQPALAMFTKNPYYYVNSAGDGVIFMAPVNGATTSGSGYPRTELREMTNNGADEASWNMNSSAINSETVVESVNHLPEVKPQIVVGQIHDSSHDIIEILADATGSHSSAYYSSEPSDCNGSGGDINNAGCKIDLCYRYEGAEQSKCLIYGLTLGDTYTLTLSVENSEITLTATYNGSTTTASINDTTSGDATGNYFKAGCYTQSNYSTEGNYVDYGQDTIYNIADTYNP